MNNYYKNKLKEFTGIDDFKIYFNNVDKHIIKYSDLQNYKTIDDLFDSVKDYKIILIETKKNMGHWVCVMKNNDIIEEFDSYGGLIDNEFNFINDNIEKELNEYIKYWTLLKNNTNYKYQYNKIKFQKTGNNIATCGRHTIMRIIMFLLGYDLNDYINFMKQQKKEQNKNFDILVVDFINKY